MMCILLVEDEWLIRTVMVDELLDAGYDVKSVETGDAAVGLVDVPEPEFTILVTDIHMPGRVDGIALARLVREKHPRIPIIYTTGRPDALDYTDLPGGKVTTLVKPYKPSRLIEAVRNALAS